MHPEINKAKTGATVWPIKILTQEGQYERAEVSIS